MSKPGSQTRHRRTRRLWCILGLSLLLLTLWSSVALADDCKRDWRRAED